MNIPPPAYKDNDDSQTPEYNGTPAPVNDDSQTPEDTDDSQTPEDNGTPSPVNSNLKASDSKRINDLGMTPPLPSFPVERKLIGQILK